MSEGSPRQDFEEARSNLWIEPAALAWKRLRTGYQSTQPIEGAPEGAECRLVIGMYDRVWPSGSLSLLWRGTRLFGLDLDGPPHRDAAGRSVPTPHRQWIERDGREWVEPVNLAQDGMHSAEQAVRAFLQWVGLRWSFVWSDPPLQARLPRSGRQPPARRRCEGLSKALMTRQ